MLAPMLTSDDGRLAIRRRIAGRDNDGGAAAILLESVRCEYVGNKPSVIELADAAGRIANDAGA